MKKHFSARAKWLIVIAVLLAMGITVFHAVSSRRPGQTVVQTILAPFRSAGSTLVRQVERYYDYVFQYESLQAENKALREQIMAMEEDVRSADSLQRENERLHQLLGLVEEHRDYYPTSAYIISWNGSNWKSAFTIDKGTSSGIEEGMVAITEYSQVVGLVTEAGPNWATVTTVLDSVLGISASGHRLRGSAPHELSAHGFRPAEQRPGPDHRLHGLPPRPHHRLYHGRRL